MDELDRRVYFCAESTVETEYPEALIIVASDFHQANLKNVPPKYHQHVSCPTRGLNILDHCDTTIKGAHHPHFGKSDHNAVLLLPVYKLKLKDAFSLARHSSLEQLDKKETYIRLRHIDCSTALIPNKPISKLQDLRLGSSLCNWILDFLTIRP
eukprot:g27586.t1